MASIAGKLSAFKNEGHHMTADLNSLNTKDEMWIWTQTRQQQGYTGYSLDCGNILSTLKACEIYQRELKVIMRSHTAAVEDDG